ncbi:MAG: putative aminodeoxychorismate lyase [Bacteroidetes bacterium ADurb.Bin408]|nr:MAG: putative aminodeoxychorismate lyase [Bacteroidetes bacterium ADurb.Bin408]
MFLPNTYEFYWNTSAEQFMERMHKEYIKFWNAERVDKASAMSLSTADVSILASIVKSETNKADEMSRIAGVYINRLNRGMPLQADPTVIYAWGDFTIKRLLLKHLDIDSPYNTYKNTGLPPGPITLPEGHVIDKVLDYEKHNYLYFCAKEDLSGYHVFANNYNDHQANARRYQKALNKLNIR